jgi:hypothetical protein
MTKMTTIVGAGAILIFTAAAAIAAPCAVGTTTGANGAKTGDTSSNVDGGSSAKVTPGAKAESPGTVGALNNVGSDTQIKGDEKKPAEGQVVKPGSNDC